MKPLVQLPDFPLALVDLAADLCDEWAPHVDVGQHLGDWTPDDDPFVLVASDGIPLVRWPVVAYPSVRFVVHSGDPAEARQVAHLLHGLLCAHSGGGGVVHIAPLAGPLSERDKETAAELCWFTVRATVRTTQIEAIGS